MGRIALMKFVVEKLVIPAGNLGIPRRNMPQIEDEYQDDYLDFLADNGVRVKLVTVRGDKIKPIQKEIRSDVVDKLSKGSPAKLDKPLVISSDTYLLDGHHRWLALLNQDKDVEIKAYQASAKMKELLELTHKFKNVIYKDNHNKTYSELDSTLKSF